MKHKYTHLDISLIFEKIEAAIAAEYADIRTRCDAREISKTKAEKLRAELHRSRHERAMAVLETLTPGEKTPYNVSATLVKHAASFYKVYNADLRAERHAAFICCALPAQEKQDCNLRLFVEKAAQHLDIQEMHYRGDLVIFGNAAAYDRKNALEIMERWKNDSSYNVSHLRFVLANTLMFCGCEIRAIKNNESSCYIWFTTPGSEEEKQLRVSNHGRRGRLTEMQHAEPDINFVHGYMNTPAEQIEDLKRAVAKITDFVSSQL